MSKHSPTPWSIPVDEEGWLCINCPSGAVVEWTPDGCSGYGSKGITLEDAKHIVKCVNMHEELVKCLEHLKYEAKYSRDDGQYIQEVLAKAKGE